MLSLYHTYYTDRDYTQRDLFALLATELGLRSALYPGSFVHISPSYVIPAVCYVDTDRKAKAFFRDIPALEAEIHQNASYTEPTAIRFYGQDYTKPIAEPEQAFDLLISQYAGIISQPCKRYLKPGKYLLSNNSHGDAGIAALDPDYTLLFALNRRDGKYGISQTPPQEYFIPKKPELNTAESILALGKGIAYTKTAPLYLFQLNG
ncbi:MAG TPA: hypothetical protein PKU80_04465 [Candidatus Limiplasma sp.]|nr:hypothetical protein [Candidatus Limiplasma sp.]HRX07721.1 hypothetical protein [Candidatus Limiplasma sp.]